MAISSMYFMRRFLALLLVVFMFAGCNKKEQPDGTAVETAPMGPTLGVPMPTADILAALGPENDIPIYRLLPEPVFVAVGKPKQFLDSPVSTGGEWLVANTIVRGFQLYNIDPGGIERVVQSAGIPMPVLINVPDPQNPMAMPQQRVIQIQRRAMIVTFSTVVDKPLLVASIMASIPGTNPALLESLQRTEVLESLKRTEGKNEYYDLTPPNFGIPQRLALGLINERTVVIVEGVENDIKAVFTDVMPKSAILDRLKHTPVDTNDLTILTSLEGLNVNPEELESMLTQISNTGFFPSSFVQAIKQHLRALTLSLKVSAPVGQPILSAYVEGRDEEGAKVIGETISGVIIFGQTTLATMNEDAKQMLPIPPEFALSMLNAISVETRGTKVNVSLNNFESLIPTINTWISGSQTGIEQDMLVRERMEQLRMLAGLCLEYHSKHGKFPADIMDTDGKPLLSWRVALLPQMGLEELYHKFKLDEPWDSETNRELMATMPMIFHPIVPEVAVPKTVVRFFDSPGTPFANRELKLEDVALTHETLMLLIVAPGHAVEWTKPEPLAFDPEKIADIAGNTLLGVSFVGQAWQIPVLPESDPQYGKRTQDIEAFIRGTGLSPQEPETQGTE